jgi:hypothetical protein
MKRICIFLVFCFHLSGAVRAEGAEFDFSWGVGDMAAYFSRSAYTFDGCLSLGQFTLLINQKIGIGFNLFNMGSISNGKTISYAFLPMKAEYRLVNFEDIFGISLYGKAAWLFTQREKDFNPFAPALNNGFSGTVGLELLLHIPLGLHYEGILALFAESEYGIPKGFKVGIRIDLFSLLALFLVKEMLIS